MNHVSLSALVATLAVSALSFGCSSSTTGTGAPGGSTETFTDVYTTILQPKCSGCHAAGAADSFMDFSTQAKAFSSLVGVTASGPACGTTGDVRVVAGNPSTSLLYEKVTLTKPPCGVQMPYGGPYLAAGDEEKIATWIQDGAQND